MTFAVPQFPLLPVPGGVPAPLCASRRLQTARSVLLFLAASVSLSPSSAASGSVRLSSHTHQLTRI